MSSTYRGICLNHLPALEFPEDSLFQNLGELIEVWQIGARSERGMTGQYEIHSHARCDVMFGRYSYPLIEVYCPPNVAHGHAQPLSMSANDLRSVFADLNGPKGPLRRAALKWAGAAPCWSLKRLRALEPLLNGEGL